METIRRCLWELGYVMQRLPDSGHFIVYRAEAPFVQAWLMEEPDID